MSSHVLVRTPISNTVSYGHHCVWLPILEIKTKVNLCMVEYAGKVLEFYMKMEVDNEMMETLILI